MYVAIKNAPNIIRQLPDQRYTVRLLKLQRPEPRLRWAPGKGGAQPASKTIARTGTPGGQPSAPSAPRQPLQPTPAVQTLVQPYAPPNQPLLQQVPIPTVVMWRPEKIPVLKIVPAAPQKLPPANVHPSLIRPNLETHVADVELSSTAYSSATLPVSASTNAPVALRIPGVAIPESASTSTQQATSASVVSVSDVLMAKGIVALPLANETASVSPSDSIAPGKPDRTSATENGAAQGRQTGKGPGATTGQQGTEESASSGVGGTHDGELGPSSGSDTGTISGDPYAVDRIALPRNGEYGVVVVGASLADEYPETRGIWAGRLAYTVYLHVGLAKNWILQYSLPRAVNKAANTGRLEAPWPYLIVRPHLLPSDSDSDDIMVHGFIDSGGHFKQLAIVFPPQFAQAKFVLGSLQQWEFRPARKNGQLTPVEVLLIIPEETE